MVNIKAVKEGFKRWESLIAFDRFHVAQHRNKAVDKVWVLEHRELKGQGDSEFTGTRFDWLLSSSKTGWPVPVE